MLEEIPSRILTEWQAYAALEPFGAPKEDERAGILAALLANGFSMGKAKARPEQFFPTIGSQVREQPWQEQLARVRAITEGGR